MQTDPKDKIKLLYDAVSSEYDLGTEEEFRSKLADSKKRKALYDAVGADYNLGTYDEFEEKVGFKKKALSNQFSPSFGLPDAGEDPILQNVRQAEESGIIKPAPTAEKKSESAPITDRTSSGVGFFGGNVNPERNKKLNEAKAKEEQSKKEARLIALGDEAMSQYTSEELSDPTVVDKLFNKYIDVSGERSNYDYKKSKSISQAKSEQTDPMFRDAPNELFEQVAGTIHDNKTGLDLELRKSKFISDLVNAQSKKYDTEQTKAKISLIESQAAQLNELDAKIKADPENNENIEMYNSIVGEYNEMLNDDDIQGVIKLSSIQSGLSKQAEEIFTKFPKTWESELEKKTKQDKVNKMFEIEKAIGGPLPFNGTLGNLPMSWGTNNITRALTKFAGNIAKVPAMLDFDNEYGKLDVLVDTVDELVENVNNEIAPIPDYLNSAMFYDDENGKKVWRKDLILPKVIQTGSDMATLLFGAGKISSGVKALSAINKGVKIADKTADVTGLMASTFLQTFDDYKKEAIETGKLSPREATLLAYTQATLEGAIESITPQRYLFSAAARKEITSRVMSSVMGGASIKEATKEGAKFMVKQAIGELGEEYTQAGKDFALKNLVNYATGEEAFDTNLKDLQNELLEVTVITPIVASLPAGPMAGSIVTNRHALYDDAIKLIASDRKTFMPMLQHALTIREATPEFTKQVFDDIAKEYSKSEKGTSYWIENMPVEKEQILERIETGNLDGIEIYGDEETMKLAAEKDKAIMEGREKVKFTETIKEGDMVVFDSADKVDPSKAVNVPAKERKRLGRAMKSIFSALSKTVPNLKITVYADDEAGQRIFNTLGVKEESMHHGFFEEKSETIFLNAKDMKSDTPFHEAIHPIINVLKAKSADAFNKLASEAAATALPKSKLIDFLASQENPNTGVGVSYLEANNGNVEEALVEMLGDYAQDKFDKASGFKETIRKFIESIMELAGIKPADLDIDLDNDVELKSVAETIAGAFVSARPVRVKSSKKPRIKVKGEIQSSQKKKTGKAFAKFFSDVSAGRSGYSNVEYKPVVDLTAKGDGINNFVDEYVKHRGNFDDHISKSIPSFRETQVVTGAAIVASYDKADLLDIGGSDNSWAKTISSASGGNIKTTTLDPNPDMKAHSDRISKVEGNEYVPEAFMSGWEEDNGTVIPTWEPKKKYDIVHEAMTFQFINNERESQIKYIKDNVLKDGGVVMLEEKLFNNDWVRNEKIKDSYKEIYFTKDELAKKKKEVLEGKGDQVEGMESNMITEEELDKILSDNFRYVEKYWDAGNFKGYIATDNKAKISQLLDEIGAIVDHDKNVLDFVENQTSERDAKVVAEVEKLKALPVEEESGATMNLDGTPYTGGGLVVPVVSKNYKLDSFNTKSSKDFVSDHSDKIPAGESIVKLGVYKFPNKKEMSLDLNIVVPAKHRDIAIEFGRLAGQESLFDLDSFENVKTGADGTNPIQFTSDQFREIASALAEGKMPESVSIQASVKRGSTIPTVKGKSGKPDVEFNRVSDFINDKLPFQANNFALRVAKGVSKGVRFPFENKTAAKKIESLNKKIQLANNKEKVGLKKQLKKVVDSVILDFKEFTKTNLQTLLDSATPEFVELSRKWYEGANKIALGFSDKHNISHEEAAAVIASLSPQQEWFKNLAMADRVIDIHKNKSDIKLTTEIYKKAIEENRGKPFESVIKKFNKESAGKSINEISAKTIAEFEVKAVMVRILDAALNDKKIASYSPDGSFVGEIESGITWGSNNEIAKALMVLDGHPLTIISQASKVRSFYNNIIDPFNENPYVTVDTHATSAGWLTPLNSNQVGSVGVFTAEANIRQTILRESYEEVAKDNNMLPRELQSVLWELQRTGLNRSDRGTIKDYEKNFYETVDQFKNESHEKRAYEILRRNRSVESEWTRERGISPQRDDFGWIENIENAANETERSPSTVSGRGSEQVRGDDTRVVLDSTGSFPADWGISPSKKRLNRTAERIALDENTRYKEIQKEVLSNPQRYSYTPQDVKNKKIDFTTASDQDIVKEIDSLDNLLGAIDIDNNFAVLAAIEAINRMVAKNQDTKIVFDKLHKLGRGVGQLLRQFAELKTASPEGIIKVVGENLKAHGYKLSDEQRDQLQTKAREFIKSKVNLDQARTAFDVSDSDADLKALMKATESRDKKFQDLSSYVGEITPFGLDRMLSTILQGNLLKLTSIGANVAGNVLFLPLRQVELLAGDIGSYIYAKMNGIPISSPLVTFGVGAGRGAAAVFSSLPRVTTNVIKGQMAGLDETIGLKKGLHPRTAWKQMILELGKDKSKKTLPLKGDKIIDLTAYGLGRVRVPSVRAGLYAEKVLEGTAGINAEIMFRMLYATDEPFKAGARAAATYRMWRKAGSPDTLSKFAASLTDGQKTEIEKSAQEATFSDERTLSKLADKGVNALRSMINVTADLLPDGPIKDSFNVMANVILKANIPFVRVPANLVQYMIELTMPIIPLLAGIRYMKGNPALGSKLIARSILGFGFLRLADAMITAGAIVAGADGDDEEERALKYEGQKPNTINVDAVHRMLARVQDASNPIKKGDRYVEYGKLGPLGVALVARAKLRERIEQGTNKKAGKDFAEVGFFEKTLASINAASRSTMELSFLQGTSAFVEAIKDEGIESYVANLGNTMMAIPLPNNVTALTMARRPVMLRGKDNDSVTQDFIEKQSVKWYPNLKDATEGVYPVISMWGKQVEQNPKGSAYGDMNPFVRQFFDITRSGEITDPITIDIWNLSKRTGEFPVGPPKSSFMVFDSEDEKVSVKLDEGDFTHAQVIAGELKRMDIAEAMTDPEWATLSDKEKVEWIRELNNKANTEALNYVKEKVQDHIDSGSAVLDAKGKRYRYLKFSQFDYEKAMVELQSYIE